jgi:hypothetical protein
LTSFHTFFFCHLELQNFSLNMGIVSIRHISKKNTFLFQHTTTAKTIITSLASIESMQGQISCIRGYHFPFLFNIIRQRIMFYIWSEFVQEYLCILYFNYFYIWFSYKYFSTWDIAYCNHPFYLCESRIYIQLIYKEWSKRLVNASITQNYNII